VVWFQRDTMTGHLTFMGSYLDGAGAIDGLQNCVDVAVSPDGANLYSAAQGDAAIAVFDRDPATGALTWVEAHFDDLAEVDGLDRVFDVMVSPDGKNVYAGSIDDDAVAVFSRDPATGLLSHVETHTDGVAGVTGLTAPEGIIVDPDARLVMAFGTDSNSIAIFRRDPATGFLEFSGVEVDGVNGVDGLADPSEGCIDPMGRNLHVASWDDDAISVFLISLFIDGFETGDSTLWSGP